MEWWAGQLGFLAGPGAGMAAMAVLDSIIFSVMLRVARATASLGTEAARLTATVLSLHRAAAGSCGRRSTPEYPCPF